MLASFVILIPAKKKSILTMKLQLDTIIIFVQNIDKLKSFYIDILALDIIESRLC